MKANKNWSERIKFFLLGMLAVLGLLMVTGAGPNSTTPTLQFGRYQISAWGTALGAKSGAMGVFIVDTVSGETKTVYSRTYGNPGATKVLKNDLKKPFASIE